MGDEYPGVQPLRMSGQRPSVLAVTWHSTSFASVPPVTADGAWRPLPCPRRRQVNRRTRAGMNRWGGSARMRRVIMGAVTSPARRPDDAAGDADVMRRIRAGDRTAVDDLYARFRRPAFALARGILASWLLAVVHHKAVDSVRREESQRRRQAQAEDEMALDAPTATRDVEDDAWSRVVAEQVRTAMGVLSAPQREALTLAYYGGYTQREVAALTGTPLGTVKTRMLAGMRRLKQELGGPGGAGALGDVWPAEGRQ